MNDTITKLIDVQSNRGFWYALLDSGDGHVIAVRSDAAPYFCLIGNSIRDARKMVKDAVTFYEISKSDAAA